MGFPGSSFYRRQEAPAPEPAQRPPGLQEPTGAQSLDDQAADDATKLTPPSSYNSAYDGAAPGVTAAPTTGDQSGGQPSDRAPDQDPSGGLPSDGLGGAPTTGDRSGGKPSDRAPGQVLSGGFPSDGLGRAFASIPQCVNEPNDRIQSLTSAMEGLSTTVRNLQESVERLGGRVEQVEFEWAFWQSVQVQDEQLPDSNTAPHQAEYYQLSASGTPRSAAGRRSDPDPGAEWYDAPAGDQAPSFGAGNVADDTLVTTEGQGARQPQELPPQPTTAPTARLPLQDGGCATASLPRREANLTTTSGDPGLWPRPDVPGQLQQVPPGLIQPGITDDQGIFSRGAGASRSGALASRLPVNPRGTEVSVNQENFVSGGIAPYAQPFPLVAVTPQTIPPNTNDSDVFSFLGGAQPARPPGGHAAAGAEGPSALQLQSTSCGAPLLGALGGLAPTPPELLDGDAPPQSLSPAELNMLMKSIQVFVPEFPKLEMGDSSSRAGRLLSWRISVDQAIIPAGPHLIPWWKWCQWKWRH